MLRALYQIFISPRSIDVDSRRREFILNILLSGLAVLATLSLLSVVIHILTTDGILYFETLVMVPVFSGTIFLLLWLSRRGYFRYIAGVLVGSVLVLATYSTLTWGFLLPMTQLLYPLCIVLAGVLFQARAAIITALFCSLFFVSIAIAQLNGWLHADTSWLTHPPQPADIVGSVLAFTIIGVVTWLANTEIDRALTRARASEASLAKERDNLEIKVKERTRELEEEHLIRIMELQRFAELGKLSASMLHDIANPLTVASLNAGQLNSKYEPGLVRQVMQSLRYMERYVEGARKQLLTSGSITTFSVYKEIRQVTNMLSHQAKKQQVVMQIDAQKSLKLTGDPVKFSQLIANLVMNAVEAYEDTTSPTKRTIMVKATRYRTGISVSVHDYGKGLSTAQLSAIFKPFYTTKADNNRNMGLGLSLVKELVEKEFRGLIDVASSSKKGTTFTVRLFDT